MFACSVSCPISICCVPCIAWCVFAAMLCRYVMHLASSASSSVSYTVYMRVPCPGPDTLYNDTVCGVFLLSAFDGRSAVALATHQLCEADLASPWV